MTALNRTSLHERPGPSIAGPGFASSFFDPSPSAGKLRAGSSSTLSSNCFPSVASTMSIDLMEPKSRAEIFTSNFAKKLRGTADE